MPGFDFMDENGDPCWRRHLRFGKRGSAVLRRALTAPPHPGSVFDLSLGGCLIWLETAFPLELATLVQVDLRIEDLALRVMASVRYAADEDRVVGLQFEPMSARKTQQLTRFIEAIQAAEPPEAQ